MSNQTRHERQDTATVDGVAPDRAVRPRRRVVVKRQTCRLAQPSPTGRALFPTSEGRHLDMVLVLADDRALQLILDWLDTKGMVVDLLEPEFLTPQHRQEGRRAQLPRC